MLTMLQHKTNRILAAAAVALLVASSIVAGQRSSPQFSFPPPSSDLFSSNGQDLVSQLGQPGNNVVLQSQSQSQQAQLSPVSQSDSQLIAQSQPALVPRQPQQSLQPLQAAQPQVSHSQQSRPLVGLGAPGSSSGASSSSSSSSASSSSGGSSAQSNGRHRANSQQHSGAGGSSAGQQVASHHSAQASNVAHSLANRHPANLHLSTSHSSQTSAQHQASQQQAIEASRKADATQASLLASSGQSYHCPDSFGYFRHHKSCDKYYACENGTASLKVCGNGLMFDDADPRRENCAYPFSVDCGERTEIEAPISTPHCPRLYGLFPDTANCRVFYSCWNGEASRYECPAGLAYDSEHRVCVWADHVDRCDQSEVSDGFVCPDPTEADQPGHYTRHAHPTDCRKFYVCIEGVARPYGCSIGTVFNVDSLQCDEPENVSGCEKYYGDLDPKLAKKLARENIQQSSGGPPARSNTNSRVASSTSTSTSSSSSSSSSASSSSAAAAAAASSRR